jgi:ribosomal-protein-alanine N-acetyltransferase
VTIRHATPEDLISIAAIQAASPGAAQWDARDYLRQDCLVATAAEQVVGFIVFRRVAQAEYEILNLAVHPRFRRQGVGRNLVRQALERYPGDFFLEVRESNRAAREFYQAAGFQEVSRRDAYYENPSDSAIVMKFHSC